MKASDALAAARQLLVDAGRPLSVRRLWKQANEADDALADDVDALRELLQDKGEKVGIAEVRRGVFALADAAPRPARKRAEPEDKKRRRRRTPTQREIAGDDPATALTVEDAMAAVEAGDDLVALRRQLWDRVRARAAAVVDADPRPPTIDVDPDAEPEVAKPKKKAKKTAKKTAKKKAAAEDDVDATLRAELAARLEARAAAPKKKKKAKKAKEAPAVAAPTEPTEEEQAAIEALRGRIRGRRRPAAAERATPEEAAPEEAAPKKAAPKKRRAAQPDAPAERGYVDERADVARPAPKTPERREPVLPAAQRVEESAADIVESLRDAGKPQSVQALATALARRGRGAARALKGAISAANGHAQAAGLRPPFAIGYEGEVALTEWGLSARYRALEETILAALAEQRELVQRGLLERTSDLEGEAFEHVLTLLLTRMGFAELEVVHRSGANVALTASRGDARRFTVVAQRSWSAVKAETIDAIRGSLPHFGSDAAVVLTMGDYHDDAQAAAAEAPAVELIDGARWAALLYEHGVGVATHQPTLRYVDGGFFDALSP